MSIIHVGKEQIYKSIQDAILIAQPYDTIFLDDLEYYEKVKINVEGITLTSKINSRIYYDDYAKKIHSDGREYVTFRTWTLIVTAPHVTLSNITIENTAGDGKTVGQAVALHLYNDDINVINCTLKAHQDTLFVGPLPDDLIIRYIDLLPVDEREHTIEFHHTFKNCHIIGDVDFIFGCGATKFIECVIESNPLPGDSISYIAAPAHELRQNDGLHFINCRLISNATINSVFLARPWRDYGITTYENCYLDKHIKYEGFDKWNDTNRDKTCRFTEIGSYGPGANNSKRVKWAKVK